MIVNMYVDHLMSSPPTSSEDVWNATNAHSKLFSDAARRIGLSAGGYQEFRNALLDGKALYVRLPRHVDAMAGSRRGSVYAVHHAVMTSSVMGWRVALGDGTMVYVPQVCGNLSMVGPAHIASAHPYHPVVAQSKRVPAAFHKAVAVIPKEQPVAEQPVAMVPPVVPVEVPAAAPAVAQVVPVVAGGGSGLFFLVPAVIGGAIAGLTHGNNNTPLAPACTNGSNTVGVCTGR